MSNFYADFTATGTDSGTSWANAFDNWTSLKAWLEVNALPGDQLFIMGGQTYTAISSVASALDGTAVLLIHIIGVASGTTAEPPTFSDWAGITGRPLLAMGANAFGLDDYWIKRNLEFTGTAAIVADADLFSFSFNCKYTNSSATINRYCAQDQGGIVNCELICTNGNGYRGTTNSNAFKNYFHDSVQGIEQIGNAWSVHNNIFDTCTVGYDLGVYDNVSVQNNTFYNCTTGLLNTTAFMGNLVFSNTFSNCIDGYKATTSGVIQESTIFDYNNWFNNTRDMSWDNGATEDNSAKGPGATANDPQFTDAPNGNFTLGSASALRNAAMPLLNGVG